MDKPLAFEFLGDIVALRNIYIDSRPYFSTYYVGELEYHTVEIQFTTPSLGLCTLHYDPASDKYEICIMQTKITEEITRDHLLARYIRLLVEKDLVEEEPFEYILSPEDEAKIKDEDRNLYTRVWNNDLITPESMPNVNPEYLKYMESIRSIWKELIGH
jgi:hypothetical protein